MPKRDKPYFDQTVSEVLAFLHREKVPYFVLGGVAVSLVGEPRATLDFDLDLQMKRSAIPDLLAKAEKAGFRIENQVPSQVKEHGSLRMFWGPLPIDMIVASTPLEKEAFERAMPREIYGQPINVPTPEDLILLKIIPARPKDLLDAETIVLRYGKRLDRKYLEKWARRLCEEAAEMRIWTVLQKLLISFAAGCGGGRCRGS